MRLLSLFLVAALIVATSARAEDFETRVRADEDGTVEISNVAGAIRITAWDRKEVEVKANYGGGVTRVDVNNDGGRVAVRVIVRRGYFHDADTNLQVRVPRRSELEVSSVSANIESSGVTGFQRLKAVSGDVRADIGGDEFEVKTVSGNVRLQGGGKPADVRINTISGDARLTRGKGEVEVVTVSGNIRLELDDGESVRARTTSGSLELRGKMRPDAEIDAETVSGNFSLLARLPQGVEYEITTFSGDIDNCFGAEAVRTSRYGPGARLQGSHGQGEARVRARTMSGRVDVCDR